MGEIVSLRTERQPSANALTRLQLRVLNFMNAYAADHGTWPSMAEIRDGCQIGPRLGPYSVVANLVRKNAIPAEAATT